MSGINKNRDKMNKVDRYLECPICLERLTPPVKLCENEHAICEFKCAKKLKECPICKGDFYPTTNRFINQFLEVLPVPCDNSVNGCGEFLPPKEMLLHSKLCNFKLIPCFRCLRKNIRYFELASHLNNSCSYSNFQFSFGSNLFYDIKSFNSEGSRQTWVLQEKVLNSIFLPRCYVDREKKMFYICVHYIGRYEDSKKYIYQVKFPQKENLWFCQADFCPPFFDLIEELDHPGVMAFDLNKIFLDYPPLLLRFQFKVLLSQSYNDVNLKV